MIARSLLIVALLLAGCAAPAQAPPGQFATDPWDLVWAERPDLIARVVAATPAGDHPWTKELERVLREETNKRSVAIDHRQEPALAAHAERAWSRDELEALVVELRGERPAPGSVVFDVLLLPGSYTPAGRPATGTVLAGAVIVFPDTFRVLPTASTEDEHAVVERAVVMHETGHALGLLDLGAPLTRDRVDREDACECHSTNEASVMQAGLAFSDVLLETADLSSLPYRLDVDDRADLAALRALDPAGVRTGSSR